MDIQILKSRATGKWKQIVLVDGRSQAEIYITEKQALKLINDLKMKHLLNPLGIPAMNELSHKLYMIYQKLD
jgi:hypothetical protein